MDIKDYKLDLSQVDFDTPKIDLKRINAMMADINFEEIKILRQNRFKWKDIIELFKKQFAHLPEIQRLQIASLQQAFDRRLKWEEEHKDKNNTKRQVEIQDENKASCEEKLDRDVPNRPTRMENNWHRTSPIRLHLVAYMATHSANPRPILGIYKSEGTHVVQIQR